MKSIISVMCVLLSRQVLFFQYFFIVLFFPVLFIPLIDFSLKTYSNNHRKLENQAHQGTNEYIYGATKLKYRKLSDVTWFRRCFNLSLFICLECAERMYIIRILFTQISQCIPRKRSHLVYSL